MAKRKRKPKFPCKKCDAKFDQKFWLSQHIKREHEVFVSFLSLVEDNNSWGFTKSRVDANAFKKSPSDNALILGYLQAILKELKELKYEIQKERTLK